MAKKDELKEKAAAFMAAEAEKPDMQKLDAGILYKVIHKGKESGATPRPNSVVTVHYKGTLMNGKEFDNSRKQRTPPAFRLSELITGWKIALTKMHVGDKWLLIIPWNMGYGTRPCGDIPAFSPLIFEIELLGIA